MDSKQTEVFLIIIKYRGLAIWEISLEALTRESLAAELIPLSSSLVFLWLGYAGDLCYICVIFVFYLCSSCVISVFYLCYICVISMFYLCPVGEFGFSGQQEGPAGWAEVLVGQWLSPNPTPGEKDREIVLPTLPA